MSKQTIRVLIVLSTLSVIGIVSTQIFWVRKAYDLKEQQFQMTVIESLRMASRQVARADSGQAVQAQVVPLSSGQYLVNLNASLVASRLQYEIELQLHRRQIIIPFEYGFYDRRRGQMVYAGSLTDQSADPMLELENQPVSSPYYFVVRFPTQDRYISRQLDGWIMASVILLLIICYIGYMLVMMLRQKQTSEMQRDFFNNMTHEFQTPISAIKLAADVLSSPHTTAQPERMVKYVRMVQEEAQRLQQQVETVLTLARSEKSTFGLRYDTLDVHDLIRSVAERHGEYLSLDLQAEASIIRADRLHLTNVLSNLVDNALKYSPNDPSIRISSRTENNHLLLFIQDNGIGIAPEHQRRIFEPFYRVPENNSASVKGFGLGLSYVRKIIKAHHWKLSLKSAVGKGTEFCINIPQPLLRPTRPLSFQWVRQLQDAKLVDALN